MTGARNEREQPSQRHLRALRDLTLLAIVAGFVVAFLLQPR